MFPFRLKKKVKLVKQVPATWKKSKPEFETINNSHYQRSGQYDIDTTLEWRLFQLILSTDYD